MLYTLRPPPTIQWYFACVSLAFARALSAFLSLSACPCPSGCARAILSTLYSSWLSRVYSLLQPCQDKLRFGGRGTGGRLPSICSCWLLSLPSSKTLRSSFLGHQTIATYRNNGRNTCAWSKTVKHRDTAPFLTSPIPTDSPKLLLASASGFNSRTSDKACTQPNKEQGQCR